MKQIDVDALAKWLAKNYEPPFKLDGDEIGSLSWPIDKAQQTDIWKKRLMEFATDINVPTNGWISVKDRLPEECNQYLVCHERNMYLAWYSVSGRWYIEEAICEPGYITHWMPLPEPPKEDGK